MTEPGFTQLIKEGGVWKGRREETSKGEGGWDRERMLFQGKGLWALLMPS